MPFVRRCFDRLGVWARRPDAAFLAQQHPKCPVRPRPVAFHIATPKSRIGATHLSHPGPESSNPDSAPFAQFATRPTGRPHPTGPCRSRNGSFPDHRQTMSIPDEAHARDVATPYRRRTPRYRIARFRIDALRSGPSRSKPHPGSPITRQAPPFPSSPPAPERPRRGILRPPSVIRMLCRRIPFRLLLPQRNAPRAPTANP